MQDMIPEAHREEHAHHGPGYRTFVAIWASLMVFTVLTVWLSTIHLGFLNVVAAMTVATAKALLVVLFFMHLKYENRTFHWMVFTAFFVLAIFISMTFFDTAYR